MSVLQDKTLEESKGKKMITAEEKEVIPCHDCKKKDTCSGWDVCKKLEKFENNIKGVK